jgi:Flp pilus assembly protein TadD
MTRPTMPTLVLLAAWATALAAQAGPERDPDRAREQVDFGIDMAVEGLWDEAIFRFDRARQLDPSYAEAFNNLGVAFEHVGRLSEARAMYERALELDPEAAFIKENYERFLEIHDRRALPRDVAVPTGPAGRPHAGGGPPRR